MKPIVPDTTPPPATDIRPLREAEIPAASALVRRVFAEFEAPDYAQEGIDVFHRFIAPEALTEQFRTGALMLWGAFRQDTLAGVAAVRNRSHISLLFVDASCHRQGIARALFSAGSSIDARIAIIAITTSNSIKVKLQFCLFILTPFLFSHVT